MEVTAWHAMLCTLHAQITITYTIIDHLPYKCTKSSGRPYHTLLGQALPYLLNDSRLFSLQT